MDEEVEIINTITRNEKIRNFLINNKKKLIISISVIISILFCYFIYEEYKKKNKIDLANKYNFTVINFTPEEKNKAKESLIEIINKKDKTYSPLALYFIIDNKIINENDLINELFNVVINETSLENEIKNLLIYKKALFNSDFETENNLIQILKPIINSNSIWKSHALYLIAEYFYSKGEKKKAKEFFEQILNLEISNNNIKKKAQKRLTKDLNE